MFSKLVKQLFCWFALLERKNQQELMKGGVE